MHEWLEFCSGCGSFYSLIVIIIVHSYPYNWTRLVFELSIYYFHFGNCLLFSLNISSDWNFDKNIFSSTAHVDFTSPLLLAFSSWFLMKDLCVFNFIVLIFPDFVDFCFHYSFSS